MPGCLFNINQSPTEFKYRLPRTWLIIFIALVRTALVNIPLDLHYVLQFNQNIDEAINDAFGSSPEDFQGFWLRYVRFKVAEQGRRIKVSLLLIPL